MSFVMVDVEADGPVPGLFSMVSIGAVIVEKTLGKRFYGQLRPISDDHVPEMLAISGHSREETLAFEEASIVMQKFGDWIAANTQGRPHFVSDNGFDWMFVNWYFHRFLGSNPFGWSSTNLGSLYKGLEKSVFVNFKHLRITPHSHHPLDDALGNAEALLAMKEQYGLKVRLR